MNIYLFESDQNHCSSCYEADNIYTGFFITSSPTETIQACLSGYYAELGDKKMYFSDFFKAIADQGYGDIVIGEVNDMKYNGKHIIDTRTISVSDVLGSNFAAADKNRRLKLFEQDIKRSQEQYKMNIERVLSTINAQYAKYPEVRSKYIKLSDIKNEHFEYKSDESSHGISSSLLSIIANYELLCRCGSGLPFMQCGRK